MNRYVLVLGPNYKAGLQPNDKGDLCKYDEVKQEIDRIYRIANQHHDTLFEVLHAHEH